MDPLILHVKFLLIYDTHTYIICKRRQIKKIFLLVHKQEFRQFWFKFTGYEQDMIIHSE